MVKKLNFRFSHQKLCQMKFVDLIEAKNLCALSETNIGIFKFLKTKKMFLL